MTHPKPSKPLIWARKKKDPWLFRVYLRDEIRSSYVAIIFTNHDIRTPSLNNQYFMVQVSRRGPPPSIPGQTFANPWRMPWFTRSTSHAQYDVGKLGWVKDGTCGREPKKTKTDFRGFWWREKVDKMLGYLTWYIHDITKKIGKPIKSGEARWQLIQLGGNSNICCFIFTPFFWGGSDPLWR